MPGSDGRAAVAAVIGFAGSGSLTQGWVRLARAGILGAVSLLLATAGHIVGGGALPGAALLALTGGGLALIAVSLTGRRVKFATLFSVLALEQVLLHLLFHAASAGNGCTAVAMPGHGMTVATVCGTAAGAAAYGWSMVLGHTVAVLLTAWLMARGERWLWRVVDRIHAYAGARPARRRRAPAASIVTRTVGHGRITWLPAGARAPPVV